MKKFLVLGMVVLSLSGCGQSTDTASEATSEAADTNGSYEENVTGGAEVASVVTNDMMITDADDDNMLDPNADTTVDSIADSGFEYTVKVFDTDGDGVVSDENDTNEAYTTVINLKNISGRDIEMSDFQVYLQSADDEAPIEMTYIDTGAIDQSKFILGAEHYENYIRYVDEETHDQFTFPADGEVTFVTTQTPSVVVDTIQPAELTFMALNADGVAYYVESTTEFTGA